MKTFFKLKVFLFLFSVRGTRCRLVGGRLLTDTFLSRKNSKCESGKESTEVRYFSLIAVADAVSPQNMKRRQRLFLKKKKILGVSFLESNCSGGIERGERLQK